MSARISPPFETIQGEDQNGDPAPINVSNDGELKVRSRDVDSANIYEVLIEIKNLLIELTD